MCQIVFGCQDGKVRLANLKSAKSVALYSTGSYVVSVSPRCDLEPREGGVEDAGGCPRTTRSRVFSHCLPSCSHHHPLPLTSVCGYALCLWLTSPDGNHTLSGHLDGSIYRFSFDANGRGPVNLKIATHSVSGFPSCRGLRVLHAMPAVLLVFALRLRCPQLLRGLCV